MVDKNFAKIAKEKEKEDSKDQLDDTPHIIETINSQPS